MAASIERAAGLPRMLPQHILHHITVPGIIPGSIVLEVDD